MFYTYKYAGPKTTPEDLKKSIASCDLFLKLAKPLKKFIVEKDGKTLTRRIIPSFTSISQNLKIEYNPAWDKGYSFSVSINTSSLTDRFYYFIKLNTAQSTPLLNERRIVAAEWIKAIEKEEAEVQTAKEIFEKLLLEYPFMTALRDKYRSAVKEIADNMKKEAAALSDDWKHTVCEETYTNFYIFL